MRVLLLTHRPPRHPADGGDGCTTIGFHLLAHRPAGVTVVVACPGDGRAMPPVMAGVEWVELHRGAPGPLGTWRGRLSTVPAWAHDLDRPANRALVAAAAADADVVLALNHLVFPLLAAARGPKLVAHLVDPESLMAAADAGRARGAARVAAEVRARKFRTLERRALAAGAQLVVVSADDAARLAAAHGVPVRDVPIGVPRRDDPGPALWPGPTLVFSGRLDWEPNEASAAALVHDVLPRVRRHVPDACVRLVGVSPSAAVRALAGPHVEVVADVPDVVAEYRRGAVAVFPGGHGWGIRGSVLQAFQAGVPVVSSPEAACGQPKGEHVTVADGPDAMADAVVALLTDRNEWVAAAAAARRYGQGWPTWEDSTRRLLAVLGHEPAASPATDPPADPGPVGRDRRLVVGTCTFRRPALLSELLDAAAVSLAAAADQVTVAGIVVVDDDPEGSAKPVVDAAAERLPVPVHYRSSAARSISTARNTLVETGLERADLLAMIDDDCRPGPDWLVTLLEVLDDTDADIVSSHVDYRATPGAPAWLEREGFLGVAVQYPDRLEPPFGCTANSLFRTAWLRDHPAVRFDERFGRLGGEDMTFFAAARRAGARIRWSSAATVVETLPPSRATLRYLVSKSFWNGNNQVHLHVHNGDYGRPRLFVQAGRRAVSALGGAAGAVVRGRRPRWRWTLCEMAFCTGKVLGVAGVEAEHR
jgi:glycosyltransferase involved in cell wall biosynthesis